MAASDALDLAALARTYHEQGWVCVPQLFGAAALATMRGRIERLVEGAATRLRAEGRLQTEHAGQPFGRRMMALIEEAGVEAAMAAFGEAGSVFGVERARGEAADEDERPIYDIVTHPGVLDVLEALMGPEHPITYSYAGIMRARLPDGTNDSRNAKPFPFHQDSQYFDSPMAPAEEGAEPVVPAGQAISTERLHIITVWCASPRCPTRATPPESLTRVCCLLFVGRRSWTPTLPTGR